MNSGDIIAEKFLNLLRASGWIALTCFLLWILMLFTPSSNPHDILGNTFPRIIEMLRPYVLTIAITSTFVWLTQKAFLYL